MQNLHNIQECIIKDHENGLKLSTLSGEFKDYLKHELNRGLKDSQAIYGISIQIYQGTWFMIVSRPEVDERYIAPSGYRQIFKRGCDRIELYIEINNPEEVNKFEKWLKTEN